MSKSSTIRNEHAARDRSGLLGSVKGQNREALSPDLDRLIHERIRLGIVSALAVNRSLTFNELKKLMKTTDGNLSVHARKLEEADYITCTKSFEGRMPKTKYRLTAAGRRPHRGSANCPEDRRGRARLRHRNADAVRFFRRQLAPALTRSGAPDAAF